MINLKNIHPIGIGTWTISKSTQEKDIRGLMYSFEHGQNQIEVNASYLAGELLISLLNLSNKWTEKNFLSTLL